MTNYNKRRKKDRRRARKMADQAWEAADSGELSRALKIIRRATDLNPANPVLWNDLGLLTLEAADDNAAATAFAAAISVSPDFGDAYAHLAAIRARQGRIVEAVDLQTKAVERLPDSETFQQRLASYRSLLKERPAELTAPSRNSGLETEVKGGGLETRCRAMSWQLRGEELTRDGVCLLREFFTPEECEHFRDLFHQDDRFAKTVVMNKPRFGQGVYRYFNAPLPAFVVALRRAVYPYLREIVNDWQTRIGSEGRYPASWDAFRDRCEAAGQTSPTPLLIRYEAGGFNMPHRDLRGKVFFPIQLAVVLSSRLESGQLAEEGFTGGEFIFCDEPERKEADRRRIPAGLGDAILFCTSSRLARVGGLVGLQPVQHGVERINSGTRYVLGVPFHEYE
jgi:hypothetical protein